SGRPDLRTPARGPGRTRTQALGGVRGPPHPRGTFRPLPGPPLPDAGELAQRGWHLVAFRCHPERGDGKGQGYRRGFRGIGLLRHRTGGRRRPSRLFPFLRTDPAQARTRPARICTAAVRPTATTQARSAVGLSLRPTRAPRQPPVIAPTAMIPPRPTLRGDGRGLPDSHRSPLRTRIDP